MGSEVEKYKKDNKEFKFNLFNYSIKVKTNIRNN